MAGISDMQKDAQGRAASLPAPRTIAASKEDVLSNLAFFFGDPVVPERLRDYSEHHAMTCAHRPVLEHPSPAKTPSVTTLTLARLPVVRRPLPRCADECATQNPMQPAHRPHTPFHHSHSIPFPNPNPNPNTNRRILRTEQVRAKSSFNPTHPAHKTLHTKHPGDNKDFGT